MHGEDLLVDNGGNRETIEAIRKRLPEFDVVPPLAFTLFISLHRKKTRSFLHSS